MRLFEATGMGACLLTDRASNLSELFEADREVVTYGSADECVEKALYLLSHDAERESIARAGHARTMKEHTLAHRLRIVDDTLRRLLS